MTLDIKNFLHRLEEGRPTSSQIARMVEEEIAKAESLKMGFAEEVERAPEFVSLALRQINDYMLHLQDVQKWFPKPLLPDDLLLDEDAEDRPLAQAKIEILLRALGERE